MAKRALMRIDQRLIRHGLALAALTAAGAVVTACSPGASSTPPAATSPPAPLATGSMTLDGALNETLSAGNLTTCGAATTPGGGSSTTLPLHGSVSFGSGTSALILYYAGIDGTATAPAPSPGAAPVVVVTTPNGAITWGIIPNQPPSRATLTLSKQSGGTVHGSANAILVPLTGSQQDLKLSASWTC
jgi:hypothetical protein